MPVEITMPLSRLEQAVADARENERVMAAKVEDVKAELKAAKAAWEEAVGEVFRALDEMIADKRQMRLPFDDDEAGEADAGGPPIPPDSPGGEPVPGPVTVTIVTPTAVEVQPPEVFAAPLAMLAGGKSDGGASAAGLFDDEPAADSPTWRGMVVAEELDGPASLFDVLSVFGVVTLGQLADALQAGRTFNLPREQVHDLYEAIEDVSADDAEPIRFDRDAEMNLTVKEQADAKDAEPAKPAKKPRGKKAKDVEPEDVADL